MGWARVDTRILLSLVCIGTTNGYVACAMLTCNEKFIQNRSILVENPQYVLVSIIYTQIPPLSIAIYRPQRFCPTQEVTR